MSGFLAGMQAQNKQDKEFSFIADVEDLPESIQQLLRSDFFPKLSKLPKFPTLPSNLLYSTHPPLRPHRNYPLEDTDGVNLNLFEYLKMNLDGSKGSAKIPVPDTLVVRNGSIKAWYFWSPKEGRLMRKKTGNTHTRRFYESMERHPNSAFCAAYSVEEDRVTESGNKLVLMNYFDIEDLRDMLSVEEPGPLFLGELIDRKSTLEETVQGPPQVQSSHFAFPKNGLIQRFIVPERYANHAEVAHTVKVRWTHVDGFSAARLAAKRGMNDKRHPRLTRVATWDTPDSKLVDVIPFKEGDPAVAALEDCTARILQHIARLTRGNKQIAYIELMFRLDASGVPWLLFCP